MIKTFLRITVLVGLLLPVIAPAANHGDIREIQDTRPIIWPWSLAVDFPLTGIQGIWKVEKDDFVSYFAIKVFDLTGDLYVVGIHQLNGYTCEIMSFGTGLESDKGVQARMIDKTGDRYFLKLTVFDAKDVAGTLGLVARAPIVVISISALNTAETTHHLQMSRVSSSFSLESCSDSLKK